MKCVTHTFLNGRGGPRISTKIHCDFHPKSVFGASDVTAGPLLTFNGSRITAGPLLAFGDGLTIDTGRRPSTAAISTPFLNGSSANPLLYSSNEERSAGTARSRGARKKSPPTSPGPKISIFSFLQKHSSSL